MMQNKVRIAITGGIGSGKSTVTKIIKDLGYPVVSCDNVYTELLNDNAFLTILSNEFGDILDDCGKLDRKKLASITFNDFVKLQKLNEITHPAIMERVMKECDKHEVCFCEVPLLFECGYEKLFDETIVLLRDIDKRIKSTIERDKLSKEEIAKRIKSQFDYKNLNLDKYHVIVNDSDKLSLAELVIKKIQIIQIKYNFGLT